MSAYQPISTLLTAVILVITAMSLTQAVYPTLLPKQYHYNYNKDLA
ncbi:hypothetical protein AVDCRST_MAG81-3613 [uncultured Synechococcales cyanobacterium]|uniref:Uncharacterized protein n=1 Tax=uncultured Synechococcales cyanobacterium TaxID=1936017 RepID=A0A6J4VJ55_9CYAN|nr:hypothetical protein AVDCRST_MAG81-3613 [uncultured Synechococcales cyanobacterium]